MIFLGVGKVNYKGKKLVNFTECNGRFDTSDPKTIMILESLGFEKEVKEVKAKKKK